MSGDQPQQTRPVAIVAGATAGIGATKADPPQVAATVSLLRRFVPASAFDKSLRKRMQMPA